MPDMVMQMMTIKTMMFMAMFVLRPCEPYFLYKRRQTLEPPTIVWFPEPQVEKRREGHLHADRSVAHSMRLPSNALTRSYASEAARLRLLARGCVSLPALHPSLIPRTATADAIED